MTAQKSSSVVKYDAEYRQAIESDLTELGRIDGVCFANDSAVVAMYFGYANGKRERTQAYSRDIKDQLRRYMNIHLGLPRATLDQNHPDVRIDIATKRNPRSSCSQPWGFAIWVEGLVSRLDYGFPESSVDGDPFFDSVLQREMDFKAQVVMNKLSLIGGWHELERIAVDPRHRHLGIGRSLLERGFAIAEKEDKNVFIQSSQAARGFYENMGCDKVFEFRLESMNVNSDGSPYVFDVAIFVKWCSNSKELGRAYVQETFDNQFSDALRLMYAIAIESRSEEWKDMWESLQGQNTH